MAGIVKLYVAVSARSICDSKCTIPISTIEVSIDHMPLSAPSSMEREHEQIWQLLMRVQHLSGKTGNIAEKMSKSLRAHMEKEEALALPLLGILQDLANGKLKNGVAKRATILGAQFQKEYEGMVHGHKEIRKSLESLKKFGSDEGHLTAVRFAEALERHAEEEEEVLYPAALLAGKMASKQTKSRP